MDQRPQRPQQTQQSERSHWTTERGTLWVIDFGAAGQPGETLPAPVTPLIPAILGEVRPESAEALAKAMGLPDPDPVRKRFSTGRRCFGAWLGNERDNKIVAYGWLSQGRECVGEMEREILMQPGEAYIWDCVTLPAHRQQRLYSALLCFMVARMHEQGIRRVWIGTAQSNAPSLRGFALAGFHPVILLTYARYQTLWLTWLTGVPGAPPDEVEVARRAFSTDHELRLGPLAVGRLPAQPLAICAQLAM